jgi:hypothetical protein
MVQLCVETGANPHSMGFYLINESSKKLTLSNDICVCGSHYGFSALHGKFKKDWQPQQTIEAGGESKCWMSGRDGAAVCPAGWIIYKIEGGGTIKIEFNSAGWTDLQNRAFIQASIQNSTSLKVFVKQNVIQSIIRNGFEGTDAHRQFVILISNDTNNDGDQSMGAGIYAENIVLPIIEKVSPFLKKK